MTIPAIDDTGIRELIREEVQEELHRHAPRWWHNWYSPATAILAISLVTVVVTTASRISSNGEKVDALTNRVTTIEAKLENSTVTKDWLAREIQYQRDTYASKASVDVLIQRMEELQRQLNTIESLQRQLNDKRR